MHERKSIIVNRTPDEVYQFWHNFENFPRFMAHLESVKVSADRRSHWRATGPAGTRFEWDAETVEDRPNELIAWRSLPESQVPNSGVVRFVRAPDGQSTIVQVELQYDPPGGVLGEAIAKLFGEEPGQQLWDDLRRFKMVMEVGEVVHSESTIMGGKYPARPPDQPVGLSGRSSAGAGSQTGDGRQADVAAASGDGPAGSGSADTPQIPATAPSRGGAR